jgi:hypothetical protein
MLSSQPWGWAAYHYGRWYFDPRYGWVWVPGTEWAPAWVSFYQGGGYVGWAPLPPNVSLSVAIGGRLQLDPRSYCFVDERHFADRNVRQWVMPSSRNRTLVRTTVNVTRFSRSGDRWVNRSVAPERIERVTNRRIERRRIVDVVESRSAARPQVQTDRVALFRPQISSRVTHPPANLHRESRQVTRRPSRVPPPSSYHPQSSSSSRSSYRPPSSSVSRSSYRPLSPAVSRSTYRPQSAASSRSTYRPQSSARSQPEPRTVRYQSAPATQRAPEKKAVSKRSDSKRKHKGPPPPHH